VHHSDIKPDKFMDPEHMPLSSRWPIVYEVVH